MLRLALVLLAQSPSEWADLPVPKGPAPAAAAAPAPAPSAPAASATAQYARAVSLIEANQYGEATALLNELAAGNPGWAEVYAARCSAQLGLSRPEYAQADCRYALKLKPTLSTALYGLATAERALGNHAQAAHYYRQYAALDSARSTPELRASALKLAEQLEPKAAPSPALQPAPQTAPVHVVVEHRGWPSPQGTAHATPSRRAGSAGCSSHLDCGSGGWCKDRGDGVNVCMDRGGQDGFCDSSIDCGRGFCKDRGDGLKVCMDRGSTGSFCDSSIDCGSGLWCRDRGDGLKVCRR
jgi:hypothetical protein